jgi:hypothetical protein
MAGDIGILESIALPTARNLAEAAAAPIPVLHEYGPEIKITIGRSATEGRAARSPMNIAALSENERLGLKALELRESAQYATDKQMRSYKDVAWANGPKPLHLNEQAIVGRSQHGPGAGGGRHTGTRSAGSSGARSISPAPLAKRLKGRVAVGVIMVSGPGPLVLTSAQQVKIAAEVQNGLSWLGAQSPAKDVTWVHDSHHVTVTAPPPAAPPAGADRWEHYERPWRDAALAKLGFPQGPSGVDAYVSALKANKTADSAYCAFFVHYPLNHFAYCTGPYLVMQYDNDGWGPDNLDRVFAHESGHVFGAPDEYRAAGCNCAGSHGFFRQPNLNCESCAPGGGIECIMKSNSWAMCSVTPYHLGYNGLPANPPTGLTAHVA